MKVIIRGFGDGAIIFEDRVEIPKDRTEASLQPLVDRHLEAVSKYALHMIEFEFLDLPIEERFLRFGTDLRRMVQPRAFIMAVRV